VPPLSWLFNGAEVPEDELDVIRQSHPVKIQLTFNNQEWVLAKEFKYIDHKVERLAFLNYPPELTDVAEREKIWKAEEPIEKYPDDLPAEEIKKRDEEKARKA
jgi:hypothetical protein